MLQGGNLIICTASSGDAPSYESEDLKHEIFTWARLQAMRGEALAPLYEDTPRGKVLKLSGLQHAIAFSAHERGRKAGVRQLVEFRRLEGAFSPYMPVFVPASNRP